MLQTSHRQVASSLPGIGGKPLDSRGFTLLEIIVVCALIGIMLTISIPSMRGAFFSDPLKASARKIIGLINDVRQTAARTSTAHQLNLSQVENRIWYEEVATSEDGEKNEDEEPRSHEVQLPDSVRLDSVWLHSSGITSESLVKVWISKKGYVEPAALQLESDEETLAIQLNPFSNPATIAEKYPPEE